MRFSFSARQWAALFASVVLALASPGGFAGLPDAQDRRDVVAFLQSLAQARPAQ